MRRLAIFIALLAPLSAPLKAQRVEVDDVPSLRTAIAEGAREIRLKPGTYRLSETLWIDRELTLDGGGKATLSGSAPLPTAWNEVEPGVWSNSVPDSWGDVRSLFRNGASLPRARSDGFIVDSEPPTEVPFRNRRAIDGSHAYLPDAAFTHWGAADPGAELRLIPEYPWLMGLLPISEADPATRLIRSRVPMIYNLKPPLFGFFPGGHAWIENTRSAMDQEGEWFFNKESRCIFIRSKDNPSEAIEIARLTELLRIEGREQAYNYEDLPTKGVVLRGLTFSGARRYTWPPDKTGWGLQHDWEMYDRATAMVRMRFTSDCEIVNCRFVDSGAAGLRMDLHAQRNAVTRCEFARLGGVGVLMAGYGMGYKDVNHSNRVSDSTFSEIGTEWWASPAIFLWQSGRNQIVHNSIENTPYTGIVVSTRTQPSPTGLKESSRTIRINEVINHFETHGKTWKAREPLLHGGDNEISWNRITGVMQRLSDGNAIYISGTAGGSHIHHNWIHDVDSRNINANLRVDDDQHGVVISQNAITNCTGEGIVVKGLNLFRNNVVWKLRQETPTGRTYFSRGYLVISSNIGKGTRIERNVFVHDSTRHPPIFERTVPWKRGSLKMPPVLLSQARSNKNLWWSASHPSWADTMVEHQRTLGVEQESLYDTEPRFENPNSGVFLPATGTDWAKKIGFEGFDLRNTGPRTTQ